MKTAYLLHEYGQIGHEKFLAKVIEEAQTLADLRIAVVGNVLMDPRLYGEYGSYGDPAGFPQRVVSFIESHGVKRKNIAIMVGNRGYVDGYYSVRIDPKAKEIITSFHPLYDE